jgi:hypothetical protein
MKENTIKALIDARLVEALKNKITTKLVTIAENMGSPIIGEYNYSSMLPDFWEYEIDDPYDADRIRDASEDSNEQRLGWSYDSLRFGVNFEILVRTYGSKHNNTFVINVVKAMLNGNVVYFEEEGVIKGYAPHPNWEHHMEGLYTKAKQIEEQKEKELKILEKEEDKIKKRTLFQKLKEIWGYS